MAEFTIHFDVLKCLSFHQLCYYNIPTNYLDTGVFEYLKQKLNRDYKKLLY